MADKKNKLFKEEIEEKDESGNVFKITTEKLIQIIDDNFVNTNTSLEEIDYESIGKKLSIPKCICKKIKIEYSHITRYIYYDKTKLLLCPKTINFIDLKEDSKIYEIYNIKFVGKLIKQLNFNNPVLIIGDKEYPFSSFESMFYSFRDKFQIVDKNVIDYKAYFTQDTNKDIKKGSDLTPNFKYYFKYPSPDEEFNFIMSFRRDVIFDSCLVDKITGICGPMGIGKSTTFLALIKLKKDYCYFNIKALKEHENDILIWREKLIILEVANAMKNKYTLNQFEDIQKNINDISSFWDAIVKLTHNFIKKKIEITLILDQYKEKFDKDYSKIKKLNRILKKDSKNNVHIIISSSINDKDVRSSLLNDWLKEKKKNIFYYNYIHNLIEIKKFLSLIQNDNSLTLVKKNMIIDDFNSIPKYYYAIKSLKTDDDANRYKLLQMEKIKTSIEEFFSESVNIYEKLEILITLRGSFGKQLDESQFKELAKILPFKYFLFNLDEYIIDFSFSLVKDIFDDFLSDKICGFLKSPISSLKEGTIGDILELNLIGDLKKNIFCEFSQVIKVNSIWDLNKIESIINPEGMQSSLLLQTNAEAKYIDFAILSKAKNLLLFQCKKALKKMPETYITKQIIEYNRKTLVEKFKKNLDVSIENIYLFYVTGITFFKKDNKVNYRTWGVNEKENFTKNKKIAELAEAELFYYDVIGRKIFYENENNFEPIDNIILHAEKFSSPIDKGEKTIKNEINFLELREVDALKKKIKKIEEDCPNQFFTATQKAYLKTYDPEIVNNKIIGSIKHPNIRDLSFESMIGLKRGNKSYLLIENSGSQKNKNIAKGKTSKNEMENELVEQEQENKISLFLLKDDCLEEVENIKKDLIDNIDYAYIFEKNIALKEN